MENKIPTPGSSSTNVTIPNKSCTQMVSIGCCVDNLHYDDYEAYEPKNTTRNKLVLRSILNIEKLKRRRSRQEERMHLRKEEHKYNMKTLKIKDNPENNKKDIELYIHEQNMLEIREKIENMKICH